MISRHELTAEQHHLLTYFESYPHMDSIEKYKLNENTPYCIIHLYNKDFKNGTVKITQPGVYVLQEDIVFNPNPDNNFMPTKEQIDSGLYSTARNGGAYHLGFFAAIAIEADGVVLDLNHKTISQSTEHNLVQRFYSHIELANAPFIMNQGPGSFTTASSYKAASNVLITNGTLGKTSHHGIHGNKMTNVVICNVLIKDFEVAGIALNGAINSVLSDIVIKDTTLDVPILSSFSQTIFMRSFLKRILATDPSFRFNGMTIGSIIANLDAEVSKTKKEVLTGKSITSKLFNNPNRGSGYDGNVYGIVLNINGVVINEFLETRPDDAFGNEDIHLSNIQIKNLVSTPIEILALSKNPDNGGAYGGKRQVGPAGDVLDIMQITDEHGKYKGNVLSDGELAIAKYKLDQDNTKGGTTNITRAIVEWAEKGTNLDTVLHDNDIYFVRNGDSMGHVMKGNIGLFISGGIRIKGENINIEKVINKGETKVFDSTNVVNADDRYKGCDSFGIVYAASTDVSINNPIIHGISAGISASSDCASMSNGQECIAQHENIRYVS